MDRSIVLDVRIAKDTNAPLESLATAHLVPNRGIEGDRYYYNIGSFSTGEIPAYDVSIIEEDMYQKLCARIAPYRKRKGASAQYRRQWIFVGNAH